MAVGAWLILTSPKGSVFYAKWQGNRVSVPKKVAVFEYPDVDGATVQDLGVGSMKYPLDLIFDGANHSSIATAFEVAFLERGPWVVNHPVLGLVDLQPLNADFEHQPVKSGNATIIPTQWIRVAPRYEGLAFEVIESRVILGADTLRVQAVDVSLFLSLVTSFSSAISFIKNVLRSIENAVAKFYAINSKIRTKIAQAIEAVDRLLTAPAMIMKTVLAAINSILAIPSQVEAYVKDKVAFYKSIAEDMKETITGDREGGVLTVEVATVNDALLSGVLAGTTESTTNGTVLSREEAVEIGESIVSMYKGMILLSDENQEALIARYSQEEYFSNITTFEEMRNLVGVTLGYVLDENYSESTRRSITLGTSVATLDFAVEHYPEKSEEEAYDFLISTNLLSGDDIVTLPSGAVVVVYS